MISGRLWKSNPETVVAESDSANIFKIRLLVFEILHIKSTFFKSDKQFKSYDQISIYM